MVGVQRYDGGEMHFAPTNAGSRDRFRVFAAPHLPELRDSGRRADAEVRAYHVGAGYIRPANPDIQRADTEVRAYNRTSVLTAVPCQETPQCRSGRRARYISPAHEPGDVSLMYGQVHPLKRHSKVVH